MHTSATRCLSLLLGLGLLGATACSSKKAATNTQSPTATAATATATATLPAATATASSLPSPTAAATPTRKPSPTPTKPVTVPTTAAPTTPAPTKPGGQAVNQPKLGMYTYALSGSAQSPVLGLPQNYPAGAVMTVEFFERNPQGGGTEYGAKSTVQADQSTTTTKSLWLPDKVVLLSTNLTFAGVASYDCVYSPNPQLLAIPLAAGTIPTQSWSGAQCSGTLSTTVLAPEKVTAAGRSWDVWRIHSILKYQAQSTVDATVDTTSTFSPELGTVITSDATTTGKISGQPFSNHQVTSLTGHP